MHIPCTPGRPGMPDGRTPADVMIEQIEEYLAMVGKYGVPSTGDGKTTRNANKPKKSQITQRRASGSTMPKATAKLWGIFSGRRGRNP